VGLRFRSPGADVKLKKKHILKGQCFKIVGLLLWTAVDLC
jgi:hypothetical protein